MISVNEYYWVSLQNRRSLFKCQLHFHTHNPNAQSKNKIKKISLFRMMEKIKKD